MSLARRSPYPILCALALGALCATALTGRTARADKGITEGIYRDSAGAEHPWSIERSHTLMWDQKPYTPGGVMFRSRYLQAPSDAAFQEDLAELDSLKGAEVRDLLIEPGRGLLETSPAETQKLLDAVEGRGFAYGLRIADRYAQPLIGFSPIVPPRKVPASDLQPGGRPSWEVRAPRGRRAVYALVDCSADERTQNWAIAAGQVVVEQDLASVQVQLNPKSKLLGKNRGLLLVVPELQVEPEELGSFGDLWAGMDAYTGRVRKYLKALKFGPGLRFILDPFSAGDGTYGAEDAVFPSSEEFRDAFREWLGKNWGISTLNVRWRLGDTKVLGVEEASRLIPMWPRNDPPDGDGWLVDPEDRMAYRCTPRASSIWTDLDTFRAAWLKRSMNKLSTTLKQEAVNVPMVYSWGAYHPIFTNSPSPSGYDGLGAQLYGTPEDIGRNSAAYALAQAEEADRNTWLVASRFGGPVDPNGRAAPITDLEQLRAMWTAIREAGFRGAFLDPRHAPQVTPMARGLAQMVAGDAAEMNKTLRVCFFPMALASADRVVRLPNGVWWLPSGAPARLMRYGDGIIGYDIQNPLGDDPTLPRGTVFWSTAGKQDVTFWVDPRSHVQLYDSLGTPLKAKLKRETLRFSLTSEPILATGIDTTQLFPLELAKSQLEEMDGLMKVAETQKLDTASLRTLYDQAMHQLTPGTSSAVYASLLPHVTRLRDQLTPYIWIEGERSLSHSLSGVAFQTGCAAGTYLKLERSEPPRSGFHRARYRVDVRRDATYEIWVAGRVPGRSGASPVIWQVDDEPAAEVKQATPAGPDYTRDMAWFMLGRAMMKAGSHEFQLVFPEKGAGGRFVAGIDAVVFSRGTFKPTGGDRPPVTAPPARSPSPDEAPEMDKRDQRRRTAPAAAAPGAPPRPAGSPNGARTLK